MKRKDLMRVLKQIAETKKQTFTTAEGGNHTKVKIGKNTLIVPRHREIKELTAKGIIKEAQK